MMKLINFVLGYKKYSFSVSTTVDKELVYRIEFDNSVSTLVFNEIDNHQITVITNTYFDDSEHTNDRVNFQANEISVPNFSVNDGYVCYQFDWFSELLEEDEPRNTIIIFRK